MVLLEEKIKFKSFAFLVFISIIIHSCNISRTAASNDFSGSSLSSSSISSFIGLKDFAREAKISIGTAVQWAYIRKTNEPYSNILLREFNMLVAENEMKFDWIQYESNNFYFELADKIVNLAISYNMKVRGHTLVWHNQSGWASSVNNPTALSNILSNHIFTVMKRYSNKVVYWDVVNEAILVNYDKTNSDNFYDHLRKSFWWTNLGSNYIEYAFQLARAADPTAKLFYNDYGIERYHNNPKAYYTYLLVSNLKAKNLIDGVGFQMHVVYTNFNPFENGLELNLKRFADLGIEIHITEMDVRIPVTNGISAEEDYELQAKVYRDILSVCLSNTNVTAVVFWGFTDKYSWIPQYYPDYGNALLFDANYQKKKSYYSVEEVLKNIKR